MAFTFNRKEHGNINESGVRDLPVGKHNYEIVKISYEAIKSDKSGKRKHLVISLRHSEGGSYTRYLEVTPKKVAAANQDNEDTRARIAGDEFNTLLEAGKYKGDSFALPKAKMVYGKTVGIEVVKTVNKATKKEFVNVNQIVPDGWSADDLTSSGAPEDDTAPDDDIPMDDVDEDEDEDEAAAAAEAKKKAAAAKKRKVALAKKKAAEAAAAAAELEDEDEDLSEDEDEDDEDPFS